VPFCRLPCSLPENLLGLYTTNNTKYKKQDLQAMAVALAFAPGGRGSLSVMTAKQLHPAKKQKLFDTVQARRTWLEIIGKDPGGCA
jgi:hypothetical protein